MPLNLFSNSTRARRATINPLNPQSPQNSAANASSDRLPRLSRSTSNRSNGSTSSASMFRSGVPRRARASSSQTVAEQIQTIMPAHLREAKSPQEMQALKHQHASTISQMTRYKELIAKKNDNQRLSTDELDEVGELIEALYTTIEQKVVNSKPRTSRKEVKLIAKELKLLAMNGGYLSSSEARDENEMKRAVVNTMAYSTMHSLEAHVTGTDSDGRPTSLNFKSNSKNFPHCLSALFLKEQNSQLSDLYRAISDTSTPLDTKISDKITHIIKLKAQEKADTVSTFSSVAVGVAAYGGVGASIDTYVENDSDMLTYGLIAPVAAVVAGAVSKLMSLSLDTSLTKAFAKEKLSKDISAMGLGYPYKTVSAFEKEIKSVEQETRIATKQQWDEQQVNAATTASSSNIPEADKQKTE